MSPLYMLRLEIHAEALFRFARDQGLSYAHDEDLGYAVHAWLAASFGELAPKPFRLAHAQGPRLRLLAYSEHDSAALASRSAIILEAQGVRRAPPRPLALAHARMPESWRAGKRLSFELLACPIARHGQAEKDVYLKRLQALAPDEPPPARSAVYREWLAAQFAGIAEMEGFRLAGFQLARVLRRAQAAAECPTRPAPAITRPRALCEGTLRILDAERFQRLLRRGVGRHRAFGLGMLLLSPGRGTSQDSPAMRG